MEETFQTCIKGLADTVGSNDSPRIRLLAKVLACLEGLEREALIALSCQFSAVDPEIHPSDDVSSEHSLHAHNHKEVKVDPYVRNGSGNSSATGTPMEIEGAEEHLNDISGNPIITAKMVEIKTPQVHTFTVTADTKGIIATVTTTETTIETNAFGEEDNNRILNPSLSNVGSGYDSYGDLNDQGPITCDGECDTALSSWTQEMYFCVMCANTDLCACCHSKRLSQKRAEKSTYWRRYCGPDHCYIKGPIKDWRGVKNGVIRIGDEEIPFKEWLKDLQEVKWKGAWKKFWERQGGVRDIEG
jgi:hypothetical protein